MNQKWVISMWLAGSLFPSFVAAFLLVLQSAGRGIVLPGMFLYLELAVALFMCIVALCLWRINWKWKLLAGMFSVFCLLGQLILLGVLALMQGGLDGIQ